MGQRLMELFGKEALVALVGTLTVMTLLIVAMLLWMPQMVHGVVLLLEEMSGWYLWEWITKGPPA